MKYKKFKKIVVFSVILSMLSLFGIIPPVSTAHAINSITNAKDLISDTDVSASDVTHTFTFTTGSSTPVGGFWRLTFDSGFTGLAQGNVTCAYGDASFAASSTVPLVVDCVRSGTAQTGTSTRVVVTGMGNPDVEASKYILIESYESYAAALPQERVTVAVAIVQDVLMTAKVDSTLDFTVAGVTAGGSVNGINCDETTTATTTDFGTLSITGSTTVCQLLTVATNATNGYTVTVFQNQELMNSTYDTINSFNNSQDGTGSTTAQAWDAPSNILDVENTYGHMGLTSDDQDLGTYYANQDFYNGGVAQYAGLNAANPLPIMHHNGPADALTQNKGSVRVAYTAEIKSLQEAGDYQSTLTYIATPIY